jgi:hypothetical protein
MPLLADDAAADVLRTLTKKMRSASIRSWPASRMMIRVRQWRT